MRVRVFETNDANSEPPESVGPVRELYLGEQGSSPEQILQLLSTQFPGLRLFAFNSQDQELPGWEEVAVANAAKLSAFLADRKQLKAVRGDTLTSSSLESLQQEQQAAKPISKGMSQVSSKDATAVLDVLNFQEVDGNQLDDDAIKKPSGKYAGVEAGVFDYSPWSSEDAGTPALTEHHKQQLAKFGVQLGRGGYAVLDLHSEKSLFKIQVGGEIYKGGVDAGVVPYGTRRGSAAQMLRVAWEHKQGAADKEDYALSHPEASQRRSSQSAKPTSSLWDLNRGQAIVELIGAHQMARLPLDLDLTDGRSHTLLRLRNKEMVIYQDLTPTEAYWMMACTLKSNVEVRASRQRPDDVEDLVDTFPENALQPLRTLKRKLGEGEGEGPMQQFESLLSSTDDPAERLQLAHELMVPWVLRSEPVLPEAIRHMYA